jgi:hypothetical protein
MERLFPSGRNQEQEVATNLPGDLGSSFLLNLARRAMMRLGKVNVLACNSV